jgi:WD40 repeat protein/transcriptional regulator with XRE-family HTH domain
LPFHEQLRDERERRGWSQAYLAEKLGCDTKTVNRWENGQIPRAEYRRLLCELFGKDAEEFGLVRRKTSGPKAISPPSLHSPPTPNVSSSPESAAVLSTRQADTDQLTQGSVLREDWGEAPHLENFYGRTQELGELKQWIERNRCRIVAVLGMGGVGKTAFTATLAEQVKGAFTYVFWRSLQHAPPLDHLLQECILFVSDQRHIDLPEAVEDQILLLLRYLKDRRCLFILDNFESLLQPGRRAGLYREGYEDYGELIQLIGETQHQSCLLLTSREKPREVAQLEGKTAPVRSVPLAGLGQAEGKEILKDRDLFGSDRHWVNLIKLYSGNPLALKLIAESIQEVFGGDLARFLQEEQVAFGDITDLLDQQFRRLSAQEREIMYWLAIERETVSLEDLHRDLVHPLSKGELFEALDSLRRRSMFESRGPAHFTLQPVIMEYVTNSLIRRACREFGTETLGVWSNYAFLKAQTKDYVRESQRRLVLAPIAERLLSTLGREGLVQNLKQMLTIQRQVHPQQRSYTAGNALNFLIHLGDDPRGSDFSHLVVWQAYLPQVALPDVNFAHAHFLDSIFSNTFGNILSVAFSPSGELLAAGTATGEIWVFQARSGMPLLTCHGHTDGVWSLAFRPDGKLLASGSDDETVRIWNVETGHCLQTLQGHAGRVRAVAFHPDGKLLASGSDDQSIGLWNVDTGVCLTTLAGHTGRVWSVAFSPDGEILASGSTDQSIRLWNVSGSQCFKTLDGHTNWVRSVTFHTDGRLLASGGDDQTVRLWEIGSGHCLKIFQAHTNRVWSVALSVDGKLLASGSEDQTIRLWDIGTGHCLKTLQGHMHGVRSVAFSLDGSVLASGGDDQCLRLWEVSTGHCLKTLQGHTNRIWSVGFSSDGRTFVSCSEDQTIRLWDVSTGGCLKALRDPAHGVRCAAFSPNGSTLASCGEDQTVRLWEVSTRRCLKILPGHTNWVRCVSYSPQGNILASCGEDHTIRIWDAGTGECLRTLQGHTNWVRSVAFRPDGSLVASGSDDQTVRLWDVNTGQCLGILQGHTNRVRSVAFGPNGSTLASGSEDQAILLWEIKSNQRFKTLRGHAGWVMSVAFRPDGNVLASGSDDRTVRLWDVRTGECLKILQGHGGRVRVVNFSPNGDIFASGGDDGKILLWDVRTKEYIRTCIGERPYERMNIARVKGLTEAQTATLRALGAIESE